MCPALQIMINEELNGSIQTTARANDTLLANKRASVAKLPRVKVSIRININSVKYPFSSSLILKSHLGVYAFTFSLYRYEKYVVSRFPFLFFLRNRQLLKAGLHLSRALWKANLTHQMLSFIEPTEMLSLETTWKRPGMWLDEPSVYIARRCQQDADTNG